MDKNTKKDVWGYSAKSVHKVIQKIQAVHDKEIEALKEELLKFKKENEELVQKIRDGGRDEPPESPILTDSIAYTPMNSTFWGDIEKYLGQNHVIAYHEPAPSAKAVLKAVSEPKVDFESMDSQNNSNVSNKSNSISSEIQSIRNRYIVGRLAGEALFGNGGKLIIQKHDIITETVVEIADREGKLADLIVNMIIPMDMIKNKKGEEDA